jgi:hypothetical protein
MKNDTLHQERIQSPDGLKEYIRAVVPGMWLGMLCIFLFLAAMIIWAAFGRIDTKVTASGYCKDGQMSVELPVEEAGDIAVGNEVYADGKEGSVTAVTDLSDAKRITIALPVEEEKTIEVTIVTNSEAPISFLIA